MLWSKLRNKWQDLIDGFWLIPGVVFLLFPLLAWFLLSIENQVSIPPLLIRYLDSPSTIRTILSTISASLITVTGVVFSITMVVLQLVSSQFTPRALRTLLSDRLNQCIAGGLLGISAYAQLILVTIRDESPTHGAFVPYFGTVVAILLGFLGLALVLTFVSHTVHSIQISNIAARLRHDTIESINNPYPNRQIHVVTKDDGKELVREWHKAAKPEYILAPGNGHIQTVAVRALQRIVSRYHIRLHLLVFPGKYVTKDTIIAELWCAPDANKPKCIRAIQSCMSIAAERDLFQDPAFGIRQLADISLRALSPAINDPTTAILCIHSLQAAMEHMVKQPVPQSTYRSLQDALVLQYRPMHEYEEIFLEIGRYAAPNARVVVALLRTIEHIMVAATTAKHTEYLPYFAKIAEAIGTTAKHETKTDFDLTLIEDQLSKTLQKLV